jgi:hypothetical protein
MLKFPGKFDCIRIRTHRRSRAAHIILFVPLLCVLCLGALAQSASSLPQYPEVAWLERSTYCNPYFGFRFTLPADFKPEPIYLPVQPHGRHMLFAMHLERLDRSADLLVSAFEDSSEKPAYLAAKARGQQAHRGGHTINGPHRISGHGHELYRLRITGEVPGQSPGDESSYFFALRGYVLHIAIFTHEHDLAAGLESAIGHLEFVEPGESACTVPPPAPAAMASPPHPEPAPARLYYGPALPTDLVESTVRESPGYAIPPGEFSHQTFTAPRLGVRVELLPGWQALPPRDAYRITELMRDPTADPGFTDHRRALFRACSRVVFAAADPKTEMISGVHPGFAVAAMPQGCVPDLVLPATPDDRAASEDFATLLVRSLGVPLLGHGSSHGDSEGHVTFYLDGTLPYQLPGEKLSRRVGLRVSAAASGQWLIFVYSVTPTPAAQHELESHITIGAIATSGIPTQARSDDDVVGAGWNRTLRSLF